jgi:hypothetical protein
MSEPRRFTAIRQGRQAAEQGLPVTACPYPTDGPQGHLAAVWVRAYANHPTSSARVDYRG